MQYTYLFPAGNKTIYSLNRPWHSSYPKPFKVSLGKYLVQLCMSSPFSGADLPESKGMIQFLACSLQNSRGSKGILLLKNRHGLMLDRLYAFTQWRQQKFCPRVQQEQILAEFPNIIYRVTCRCLRKWVLLEFTLTWCSQTYVNVSKIHYQ